MKTRLLIIALLFACILILPLTSSAIITLDDPTQSMDNEHKRAFAELVSKLTKDFQVIVATEDDETRDYIRKNCPDAMYYELENWGTEGPQLRMII